MSCFCDTCNIRHQWNDSSFSPLRNRFQHLLNELLKEARIGLADLLKKARSDLADLLKEARSGLADLLKEARSSV